MSFWINAAIWAIIIGIGMWYSKPKPLTAAFIVSLYVGLETYFYVDHWLSYLPTELHILFYAIPVCVFLVASFVYCAKTKTDWGEALSQSTCWYICVIISVWLSFPTVFLFYDWQVAKAKYELEKIILFGEDWEKEFEELGREEGFGYRWDGR